MTENNIVNAIVCDLREQGFKVTTEVANFHRSADIAALDKNGMIWVIECKVSSISKAIEQSLTHKLSADKVFIGTIYRKTTTKTIDKIKTAGIGLMYVMPDGKINTVIDNLQNSPWMLYRDKLKRKITEKP